MRTKNAVNKSKIEAGNNVHIGDIYLYPEKKKGAGRWKAWVLVAMIAIVLGMGSFLYLRTPPKQTPEETANTPAPVLQYPNTTSPVAGTVKPPTRAIQKSPISLSGLVTDQDGVPLREVQVTAVGLAGGAKTDENGYFDFPLSAVPTAHEVRLHFFKAYYRPGDEVYFEVPKRNIIKKLTAF